MYIYERGVVLGLLSYLGKDIERRLNTGKQGEAASLRLAIGSIMGTMNLDSSMNLDLPVRPGRCLPLKGKGERGKATWVEVRENPLTLGAPPAFDLRRL